MLTKTNKILLVCVGLVVLLQFAYAVTSACPAATTAKSECWGPRGVSFLGLNFDSAYVQEWAISTLLVLLGSGLFFAIYRKFSPHKDGFHSA